jgi:hypothetical protein
MRIREENNMKFYTYKKMIKNILLILSIWILLCSIGIFPIASSININSTIDNKYEDKNLTNLYFFRDVFRFFLIGPIYNLSIDEDNYSYNFESEKIFGLQIEKKWGTPGYYFDIKIFNIGPMIIGFFGYKFLGIMKPDFICGCFYSSETVII